MAARWLPNLEEFFDSFCRALTDGINNLNSEDDRSDYFSRRIEDYERTLRVSAARLVEAVPQPLNVQFCTTTCLNFWILQPLPGYS